MARAALFLLARSQAKQVLWRNFSSGSGCHPYRCGITPYLSSAERNSNPFIHLAGFQRRLSSQSTSPYDDHIGIRQDKKNDENEKDTGPFIYHGPISSTIKKVKLLSLSTCCLSVSLGPVINFMSSPDMNVVLKYAVASSVILVSMSTTAALHWFVSPYVHKLRWQPGSDTFEVEMLSWLAMHVKKTIKFSDIQPAETNRPYVTFKANGKFYFVDMENCPNKTLMARLESAVNKVKLEGT